MDKLGKFIKIELKWAINWVGDWYSKQEKLLQNI